MALPELSTKERALLASLEPIVRGAVWSKSAKVCDGPYESEGKWITYPLRLPAKKDSWGEYFEVKLTADNSTEDFRECHSAFGTNQLHTAVAVYRILRELKRRGLLHADGFGRADF
jgi:hypothetical protein